nr:unnamed protein product [Papilio xuthus]
MEENKVLDKTTSDNFIKFLKTNSPNKQCADCSKHSPVWVSLSFGIFLCSDCASKHRALGVAVSKVKSTLLDTWTVGDLRRLSVSGNGMIHELGDIKDIRLKYLKGEDYKRKINLKVKQSLKQKPGLDFMERGDRKGNVIVNEVKAVPIPKFRDSEFVKEENVIKEKHEDKVKIKKENIFLIKKKDTPTVTKSDKKYEINDMPNTRLGFGSKLNK